MSSLLSVAILIIGVIITAIFYALWERKVIEFMQSRISLNRSFSLGMQPILDISKLLLKSMIIPIQANKFLFVLGPIITITAGLSAWAVIPVNSKLVLSDLNIGLLYLLAMQAIGANAVIISGWGSNSKYCLLGALRCAAQMISYSIPTGLSIIGVLIKSSSMNLIDIVNIQQGGINNWLFIPLLPLLLIYWLSSMAANNRLTFDVTEGGSDLLIGAHIEYSGMGLALLLMAQYSNIILSSVLTVIMFLGGWLSPFNNCLLWVPDVVWLLFKTFVVMTWFLWIKAMVPKYRYDQIMGLCWKGLIPLSLLWILLQSFGYNKSVVII